MTTRIVLLALALLTTALAFAPNVAAECEPRPGSDFCEPADLIPDPRPLPPLLPERCWWTEHGIYCEY